MPDRFICFMYDEQPLPSRALIDTPDKGVLTVIMTIPLNHKLTFYIGIKTTQKYYSNIGRVFCYPRPKCLVQFPTELLNVASAGRIQQEIISPDN